MSSSESSSLLESSWRAGILSRSSSSLSESCSDTPAREPMGIVWIKGIGMSCHSIGVQILIGKDKPWSSSVSAIAEPAGAWLRSDWWYLKREGR